MCNGKHGIWQLYWNIESPRYTRTDTSQSRVLLYSLDDIQFHGYHPSTLSKHYVTPVWDDFMFSVLQRKHFCLPAFVEMYWATSPRPWSKVTTVVLLKKTLLVCTIKCGWKRFFFFQMKVKHFICHISGTVGSTDVERKGHASVWNWVNYMTLSFDPTHDLYLWFFKVKVRNDCITEIVGLIVVKQKGRESIRYWADSMTLPAGQTLTFSCQCQS